MGLSNLKGFFNSKKAEETINVEEDIISKIQNPGGISFKNERIITSGDGYSVFLRIYDYPKDVYIHWLEKIMEIGDSITSIDIYTEDKTEIINNINRSFKEQEARLYETDNRSEEREAQTRMRELDHLLAELSNLNDTLKVIVIRLYIGDYNLDVLERRIHDLVLQLDKEGFKLTVDINETETSFKSLTRSISQQTTTNNKAFVHHGQPLTASTLAKGLPFNHSELIDPRGCLFGETKLGGVMAWDRYHRTSHRTTDDMIIVGNKGSGKSTTLKKLASTDFYLGHNVRVFDFMGDFTYLSNYLGGIIIYMDGQSAINVLEIMRSPGAEGSLNNVSLMRNHINKCAVWLSLQEPELKTEELSFFKRLLREFYEYKGMLSKDPNCQLVGRNPEEYPVISDWLSWMKGRQTETSPSDSAIVERLVRVVYNLVDNYGEIIDRHTTIKNISKNRFVVFNMVAIKNDSAPIFNAQFYLALMLFIDDATYSGNKMRQLYDTRQIQWEDMVETQIIIDEAHRIVNVNKPLAVSQILGFQREDRHIFTALSLATQSINDMGVNEKMDINSESMLQIKTLFEQCQYKLILKQDQNAIETLRSCFGKEITESTLNSIPFYGKGECVLVTSGVDAVEGRIYLSELEEDIFRGGA